MNIKKVDKDRLTVLSSENAGLQNVLWRVARQTSVDDLSSEFKGVVLELSDTLQVTQYKINYFESKMSDEERRTVSPFTSDPLRAEEEAFTRSLNDAFLNIDDIVRGFTLREHYFHRKYFQYHLHPLLLLSPFVFRSYQKPLGYPGDYLMMNMLYDDLDNECSLFGRLVDRYARQISTARAVKSRPSYLIRKIMAVLEETLHDKPTANITSVGSGPAREIQELIQLNPRSAQCRVTLVDMVQPAISYCRSKISKLKILSGNPVEVNYLNRNVDRLVRFPDSLDLREGQDLIYSVGLFDYLPHHLAKRLVRRLYSLLNKGGELIIGNLSDLNDCRFIMEYAAEWFLLYRTREELLSLAEDIPSSEISVDSDALGIQLYLSIKKM